MIWAKLKSAIKTGVVPKFEGEYFFLSNFYVQVFEWRGKQWFCGEQAFQWAKTLYPTIGERQRCEDLGRRLRDTGNPGVAKKYGRQVPLDLDTWEAVKVQYMREIVHARFATAQGLAGQLINTGAMLLVEGNDWGDTFWGRSNRKGLNTLGTILMEERGYWLHSDFKDKQ